MRTTIYELLGKVKDDNKTDIYVKYFNRISQKEETMWACKENIIYKLDQIIVKLNDEVAIIEESKKIEKWGEGALEEMEKCTDYTLEDLQKYIRILAETQNELIDEINNLKEND